MKGIVIGIKESRAVIMESGGSIREIANNGFVLGQEINLSRKRSAFTLPIAACFALFLSVGIGGYSLYNTPQSYLYVDINPSLRLEINRFDKVLSAVPLNEDAVVLLEQCALDLSNGQRCIDSLIQGSLELGFLGEDNLDVEIDLHTSNEQYKETVIAASERISENGISVTVFELDRAQNTIAIANGISASRMRAVESYTEFFGGTFDGNMLLLADTASPEIYAQIREHRRSTIGSEENAYAEPQLSGEGSKQGGTQSLASEPSPEYLAKRRQAIESYTEYFGGGDADNSMVLESLTIGEIYEYIKANRSTGQAGKQRTDSTNELPAKTAKPLTQNKKTTTPQLLERRQQAIQSYTDYFGGSMEENEKKLAGVSIAQIYEAIRSERVPKDNGR